MSLAADTIVAIATPPGKGGVAIIRVSGPLVIKLAKQLLKSKPIKFRTAYHLKITNKTTIIDDGILLIFNGPKSYTGEDVLEFQGHGSPVIAKQILNLFISKGCRLATPGEFTRRAFLNNKLDLIQAEAVINTINAQSEIAAKGAMQNLQGEFSHKIKSLAATLLECRMLVEAAIDFSDQPIETKEEVFYLDNINNLIIEIGKIIDRANTGFKINQGFTIALIGPPNVGKSSLFNLLCNKDAAIVDSLAGTTRDILEQPILINGIAGTILDTAGIHNTDNKVEQQGINKAIATIEYADLVILMGATHQHSLDDLQKFWQENIKLDFNKIQPLIIWNKLDLATDQIITQPNKIYISIHNKIGIDKLQNTILTKVGIDTNLITDMIPAQIRHIEALKQTRESLIQANIEINQGFLELVAENLKLAHQALTSIYGESHYDSILDEIFANFCIGK